MFIFMLAVLVGLNPSVSQPLKERNEKKSSITGIADETVTFKVKEGEEIKIDKTDKRIRIITNSMVLEASRFKIYARGRVYEYSIGANGYVQLEVWLLQVAPAPHSK